MLLRLSNRLLMELPDLFSMPLPGEGPKKVVWYGIERSLNAANGVARSTVKYRGAGRPERNPWSQTLLHKHQETQLIDWIRELETWGFPVRVDTF